MLHGRMTKYKIKMNMLHLYLYDDIVSFQKKWSNTCKGDTGSKTERLLTWKDLPMKLNDWVVCPIETKERVNPAIKDHWQILTCYHVCLVFYNWSQPFKFKTIKLSNHSKNHIRYSEKQFSGFKNRTERRISTERRILVA